MMIGLLCLAMGLLGVGAYWVLPWAVACLLHDPDADDAHRRAAE